jgi:hypothetical protein
MRTTLDIDDDVLQAARERARREKKTIGATVTELVRRALTQTPAAGHAVSEPKAFHGFRPYRSPAGKLVTNELVNKLRDEDIY